MTPSPCRRAVRLSAGADEQGGESAVRYGDLQERVAARLQFAETPADRMAGGALPEMEAFFALDHARSGGEMSGRETDELRRTGMTAGRPRGVRGTAQPRTRAGWTDERATGSERGGASGRAARWGSCAGR